MNRMTKWWIEITSVASKGTTEQTKRLEEFSSNKTEPSFRRKKSSGIVIKTVCKEKKTMEKYFFWFFAEIFRWLLSKLLNFLGTKIQQKWRLWRKKVIVWWLFLQSDVLFSKLRFSKKYAKERLNYFGRFSQVPSFSLLPSLNPFYAE